MNIDISKIYMLKNQDIYLDKHNWEVSKLNGSHPIILIPKPQSLLANKYDKEVTFLAIAGTSQDYYLRDHEKYLFKKELNKTTYFFSSEIRTVKESDIIESSYTQSSLITNNEFQLCYNTVKDYILDIEKSWIDEYYEKLFLNLTKGENMTAEEREEKVWSKLRKLPSSREVMTDLQNSIKELKESNLKLQESNRELQESNREFRYMFLKEREDNGVSLTPNQTKFLTDYEEKYLQGTEEGFEL